MPETNVYFVRHAEPDLSNHDDLTRARTDKGMRDRLLVTAYRRTPYRCGILQSLSARV